MRPVSSLAFAAAAFIAAPAFATTTYRITYQGSDQIQSAPIRRDQNILLSADGTLVLTVRGFAYPGHVGIYSLIEQYAGPGGGGGRESYLVAETDEFVISGPAAPSISGSLHLRYRASHALAGGYPGNGAHGLGTDVQAMANHQWRTGNYWYGNSGTATATGIFAGQSGPSLDVVFSITGTFPVGTPFPVRIQLFVNGGPYGNIVGIDPDFTEMSAGNPATGPVTGGLQLHAASGVVMTLPPGYTVNCPSWGIVNNTFQSTVAVERELEPRCALAIHPNPMSRESSIELTLPSAGEARVELFDAGGRRVRTLAAGWQPAGTQPLHWDGRTEGGAAVPPGLYFVRAVVAGEVLVERIVRLE